MPNITIVQTNGTRHKMGECKDSEDAFKKLKKTLKAEGTTKKFKVAQVEVDCK